MGPWAMGPWAMGPWAMGPWAMGPWAMGPWAMGRWAVGRWAMGLQVSRAGGVSDRPGALTSQGATQAREGKVGPAGRGPCEPRVRAASRECRGRSLDAHGMPRVDAGRGTEGVTGARGSRVRAAGACGAQRVSRLLSGRARHAEGRCEPRVHSAAKS